MAKKLSGLLLGFSLSLLAAGTAFGAEGTWIQTDGGWQYKRPDGGMARGTWEDIDGEWYFFDRSGFMETGWNKVGNIRYYFEESGALSEGWQRFDEGSGEQWYYFDSEGNAKIRWMEENGKWYWFNSNGVLNQDASKTIDGKKYYFHEDGSLVANEYIGIKYIDSNGRQDSDYDVRGEKRDGKKFSIEESDREMIAEELNALPAGWLKKFVEDDWHFVYCPEKEYYSAAKYEGSDDRYYIRYKASKTDKTLRFTTPEAIHAGFGEYVYLSSDKLLKDYQFKQEANCKTDEILKLAELPDYFERDYAVQFGVLFNEYLDEDGRAVLDEEMDDLAWIVGAVIGSR